MIEVERLVKKFGDATAVHGVSFQAPDAAVTGLLGPNGAGKTTSLRMIYGLLRPDGGMVRIDGQACDFGSTVIHHQVGVLPDQSGLYPRLTARENISYFGSLHSLGGKDLESRVEQLVQVLELKDIADRRVAGFSHGERTKVALARALVHEPQNIILDEPTNGLDVMSTRILRDVIRRLKSTGRCVLFSSHVMQEVSALCDRIVVIASGNVVAAGTTEELLRRTNKTTLEDAFVCLVGRSTPQAMVSPE